ncbi:MAG: 4Fe-4S binding protein, partial [Deltaproteobacteria bacterium]|nr:4Fe-4S binding protein [Deltaproteobacteria bacterium]
MKHLSIVRAFTQYLALALFILTLYFTMAGTVDLYPMNFFLRIDPLAALSTILSSGGFESILKRSFAVVLLTLVFGRFFCGFICPMGTLSHLAEKIAALRKKMSELPDKWEYRELYSVKYYIFLSLCVLAL